MDRFDLGSHTRAITTTSLKAQRYFDLGLNWCFGFNHEEGLKCFQKVLEFAAQQKADVPVTSSCLCRMAHL